MIDDWYEHTAKRHRWIETTVLLTLRRWPTDSRDVCQGQWLHAPPPKSIGRALRACTRC